MSRYIFSEDIPQSINEKWAAVDLTSTLLAYLGSGVLDQELEDEDVQENILNGYYTLFEYANFFWPVLFNKTALGKKYSSRLGTLLDRIIQGGKNYNSQDGEQSSKPLFKNHHLESSMPDVYHVLCETFRFRLMDERWEWNRSNSKYCKTGAEDANNISLGDLWSNKDPLNTSKTLVRIQGCQEKLAFQPIHQARLQSHYGSGLFKCTYPFCAQSYRGFEAESDRNEHLKIHGKPWKCSISNCPYGSIGFSSKSGLDEHWSRLHILSSGRLSIGITDPDSLDVTEAQPILFLLVIEDNVADAKRILAAPGGRQLQAEVISSARQMAAKRGCLEMVQLLAPPNEVYMPYRTVVSAVGSQDVTVAKAAIAKAQPDEYPRLMKALLKTDSDEIYALWEEHINSVPQEIPVSGYQQPKNLCDQLFKGDLFNLAKGKPLREARLRQALRMLSHHMTPSLLGTLLVRVAKSSCSSHLAEELLDLGAPVDYPWGYGKSGMTALHIAAKKTTEEAAFFMQYLISQGAAGLENRYPVLHDPVRIAAERGAMGVLQYVGQTFEEMRRQSLRMRSGGVSR